jgi:hypothetical protein
LTPLENAHRVIADGKMIWAPWCIDMAGALVAAHEALESIARYNGNEMAILPAADSWRIARAALDRLTDGGDLVG